ncbi:MAG: type II secretion system protein [Thiotrichaceae bacterium]
MKLVVGFTAIIMLLGLAIYSAINLFVAPIWMVSMISYSSILIYMIAKEIAVDLKKVRAFTLIELMTVLVLTAILLSIAFKVMQPDRAAAAIKQVGGNINVWSAKAMSENTNYRLEFTVKLLEVYDIDDNLVYSEKIISSLTFTNGTNQTIELNDKGSMEDVTGARILADTWVARVNGFTGHLSYYD